jgi:hypothetical protein
MAFLDEDADLPREEIRRSFRPAPWSTLFGSNERSESLHRHHTGLALMPDFRFFEHRGAQEGPGR